MEFTQINRIVKLTEYFQPPWRLSLWVLLLCFFSFGKEVKEKQYYIHFGVTSQSGKEFYNANGKIVPLNYYTQNGILLSGHYWFKKWGKVVWKLPIYYHEFRGGETEFGFGDGDLEVAFPILKKGLLWEVGIGVQLPMGEENTPRYLNLGEGVMGYQLSSSLQKSFFKKVFLEGRGRYQFRSELTDRTNYKASISYKLKNTIRIGTTVRGQRMVSAPLANRINPYLGFGEGVESDKQGILVLYPSGSVMIHFQIMGHYWGEARNIMDDTNLEMGMGIKF